MKLGVCVPHYGRPIEVPRITLGTSERLRPAVAD
jgi:hypothetical protein